MARPRLPIVPHPEPEELARRYRARRGGVEKAHRQVIRPLTRTDAPPAPASVAACVGLTPAWVRTLLKRGTAAGPAGWADRRPTRNGGRPQLSEEQPAASFEALQGRPVDGGLWTGPKVAASVRDRRGVAVRHETGWRWLKRLGDSLQARSPATRGRPRLKPRGDGKGDLAEPMAALRRDHPERVVEL